MRWLLRIVNGLCFVAVAWLLGTLIVCLNYLGASTALNLGCVLFVAFIAGFLFE